jgi:hypothetical protein
MSRIRMRGATIDLQAFCARVCTLFCTLFGENETFIGDRYEF